MNATTGTRAVVTPALGPLPSIFVRRTPRTRRPLWTRWLPAAR